MESALRTMIVAAQLQPFEGSIKPGAEHVFLSGTKKKVRVLETYYQPVSKTDGHGVNLEGGFAVAKIDDGETTRLVKFSELHEMTLEEMEAHALYVDIRSRCEQLGIERKKFDEIMRANFKTPTEFAEFTRALILTPNEKQEVLHAMFEIIVNADSPMLRYGFLQEIARTAFVPFEIVEREWETWLSRQKRRAGRPREE